MGCCNRSTLAACHPAAPANHCDHLDECSAVRTDHAWLSLPWLLLRCCEMKKVTWAAFHVTGLQIKLATNCVVATAQRVSSHQSQVHLKKGLTPINPTIRWGWLRPEKLTSQLSICDPLQRCRHQPANATAHHSQRVRVLLSTEQQKQRALFQFPI